LDKRRRFYFDWAAAAPETVISGEAGSPLDEFGFLGNPSSRYAEGRAARQTLDEARLRCAEALGTRADNVYFTSGATESNAIILFSTLFGQADGIKQALLTSQAEHPSITQNEISLKKLGVPVYHAGVAGYGGVSPALLEKALQRYTDTTMLALMYVNNETGAVSDMPALIDTARRRNGKPLHIHSDMVQAAGKFPFALRDLDIDSAAFSAHKIGGPRGIGILYLRRPVQALYRGGGQERGIRPGTENTAGAFYFASTLSARKNKAAAAYEEAVKNTACLIQSLRSIDRCTIIPECREDEDERFSPYILQAAFRDVPGEVMVRALDDAGFAVSTGSACSSASKKRPVLNAMGIDDALAFTSIRISAGWDTKPAEYGALLDAIRFILKRI
jgi:cysteine desulfurase